MDSLELFLRAETESLQYLSFFWTLFVFGLLESIFSQSHAPPRRRQRWSSNYTLTALNIIILGVIAISSVIAANYARKNGIGILNIYIFNPALALIFGILLHSLISWGIHFASHKIPILWRIHRVHHTDIFIDISTTVRLHPLELTINTLILVAAVMVLGISPIAIMIYALFETVMTIFHHANIRLPIIVDRLLKIIFVTPDMHRVHHSIWQPETDSNYGTTLSIWDYLFRTYRVRAPESLKTMELGLSECQDSRAMSLRWLLSLPFQPMQIPREDKH